MVREGIFYSFTQTFDKYLVLFFYQQWLLSFSHLRPAALQVPSSYDISQADFASLVREKFFASHFTWQTFSFHILFLLLLCLLMCGCKWYRRLSFPCSRFKVATCCFTKSLTSIPLTAITPAGRVGLDVRMKIILMAQILFLLLPVRPPHFAASLLT